MAGQAPLANIAVNVVAGDHGAGTFELIGALLGLRPPAERWAVLRNSRSPDGVMEGAAGSRDIHVASIAEGCICCSAQTELRVALTRLLRSSRPHRLFVEPSPQAGLNGVLRLLADRWFGPVLELRATVVVINAPAHAGRLQPLDELARERFAAADLVAIRAGDRLAPKPLRALRESLSGAAPGALLVDADAGPLQLADLDRAARALPRPRFRS